MPQMTPPISQKSPGYKKKDTGDVMIKRTKCSSSRSSRPLVLYVQLWKEVLLKNTPHLLSKNPIK
jgi:hypothetical protein